jgi:hypothetical protein
MRIIFGSSRNVYVVQEPSEIHSTPINLKIKVQRDITPPNNLDMITFEFLLT